jgi:hypothetical protein
MDDCSLAVAVEDVYPQSTTGGTTYVPSTQSILKNDLVPCGKQASVRVVKQPSFGTVNLAQDGSFSYTSTASPAPKDDSWVYELECNGLVSAWPLLCSLHNMQCKTTLTNLTDVVTASHVRNELEAAVTHTILQRCLSACATSSCVRGDNCFCSAYSLCTDMTATLPVCLLACRPPQQQLSCQCLPQHLTTP